MIYGTVKRLRWTVPNIPDKPELTPPYFRMLGSEAAEMPVTTPVIIRNFDIVKDIGARYFTRFVNFLSYPFFLKAAEVGLGDRVVPVVASAAH